MWIRKIQLVTAQMENSCNHFLIKNKKIQSTWPRGHFGNPPPRGHSWSFHEPPSPPLTTWYMDAPFSNSMYFHKASHGQIIPACKHNKMPYIGTFRWCISSIFTIKKYLYYLLELPSIFPIIDFGPLQAIWVYSKTFLLYKYIEMLILIATITTRTLTRFFL